MMNNIKAVILAGGLGTRISEESNTKPKPMIEIGGMPIIWHIMKIYSQFKIREFVICCGYKGYLLKEFFNNYFLHMSDVTIDVRNNNFEIHNKRAEDWKITLVNTGEDSMTGGRILRIKSYVKEDECFCLTYGDGLADINITELINFHKSHNKLATLTAVRPPARFGALKIDDDQVTVFEEKPVSEGGYINGGFFVLSPKIFNYLHDDNDIWEGAPLNNLSLDGELMAFRHENFWQPMDTLRDKNFLETLWKNDQAPWKIWD